MLLLRPTDKPCYESPCGVGFGSAAEPAVGPRARLLVAVPHILGDEVERHIACTLGVHANGTSARSMG